MLRSMRTVRVTTREEFDAALASADQIIVEGRDALLSSAVSLEGLPVELTKLSPLDRPITGKRSNKIIAEEFRARLEKEHRWKTITLAMVIAVALFVIGGFIGSGWFGSWNARRPAEPPPIERPSQGNDFWASLPTVLWPVATIIAIIALFLIARQAISGGSNVMIVWKVTEKVQGRVVITKVRDRAPSKRAAA